MGSSAQVSRRMRLLILFSLIAAYGCFGQNNVEDNGKQMLQKFITVFRRMKTLEDENVRLNEANNDKEIRIQALEGKLENFRQESKVQQETLLKFYAIVERLQIQSKVHQDTLETTSAIVEKLQIRLNETSSDIVKQTNQFEDIQETTNDIKDDMKHVEAKVNNIE